MKYLIFILVLCSFSHVFGQHEDISRFSSSISIDDLKKHITNLSSDEFQGRKTGTEGCDLAADYIRQAFKSYSLNGSYNEINNFYQPLNLYNLKRDSCYISNDNEHFVFGKDFMMFANGVGYDWILKKELVFVGFGLDEDYKGIDVEGKVVVYFKDEPAYLNTDSTNIEPKGVSFNDEQLHRAQSYGASGAILIIRNEKVEEKLISLTSNFTMSGMQYERDKKDNFNQEFIMGAAKVARLLGISEEELNEVYELHNSAPVEIENYFNRKVKIGFYFSKIHSDSQNVIAYCEGSDKKNEFIIITAHYDHLGAYGEEMIFNGADDNASGIAALIELAEAFAIATEEGYRPSRSIVFMAVSAEEVGLLGSEYYTENPIFPLENTTIAINMDMIGRSDKKHINSTDYVYIYSNEEKDSDLKKTCMKAANIVHSNLVPEYLFQESGHDDSDHYYFKKNNIPVIYYKTGLHEDYHKPTDTVDKINFENMENITKLIFSTMWLLANE